MIEYLHPLHFTPQCHICFSIEWCRGIQFKLKIDPSAEQYFFQRKRNNMIKRLISFFLNNNVNIDKEWTDLRGKAVGFDGDSFYCCYDTWITALYKEEYVYIINKMLISLTVLNNRSNVVKLTKFWLWQVLNNEVILCFTLFTL